MYFICWDQVSVPATNGNKSIKGSVYPVAICKVSELYILTYEAHTIPSPWFKFKNGIWENKGILRKATFGKAFSWVKS